VLQWGSSFAGGGNHWSISSWYVAAQPGPAFHSQLIPVSPGTVLVGVMTLTKQQGGLFDYNCQFQGIANSGLPVQNIEQLTWSVQTLEAYNVTQCSDYPAAPRTAMTAIEIKTTGGKASLKWQSSNPIADCNQHTSVVSDASLGGEVDFFYRSGSEQPGWRWCHKCQGMFFGGNPSKGICPADHLAHSASQSGHYAALLGDEAPGQQGNWRWCHKCQGMFFNGNPSKGICPADHLAHSASQSGHYAAVFGDDSTGQQANWRWCHKCQGMFFNGNPSNGKCPVDGKAHDASQSGHYTAIFTPIA
jgi:hypothetical protein